MSLTARVEHRIAREPKIPIKTKTGAYNLVPKEQDKINQLADEMVEWFFLNKTAINLDKFPLSRRFSPFRFYKLAENNPYFEEALEVCRYLISDHIQDGWSSKELDSSFCKEMLPKYDKEYREWIRSKIIAAMEARNAQKDPSNLTVILEAIPTTSEVPERVDDSQNRNASQTK
jgi:hypothetical protein